MKTPTKAQLISRLVRSCVRSSVAAYDNNSETLVNAEIELASFLDCLVGGGDIAWQLVFDKQADCRAYGDKQEEFWYNDCSLHRRINFLGKLSASGRLEFLRHCKAEKINSQTEYAL